MKSRSVTQARVQGLYLDHCNLCLLGLSYVSQVAGITGMRHHAQVIFVFLEEMGFHHFGHAAFKLLASSDTQTLASQNAAWRILREYLQHLSSWR